MQILANVQAASAVIDGLIEAQHLDIFPELGHRHLLVLKTDGAQGPAVSQRMSRQNTGGP